MVFAVNIYVNRVSSLNHGGQTFSWELNQNNIFDSGRKRADMRSNGCIFDNCFLPKKTSTFSVDEEKAYHLSGSVLCGFLSQN